MEEKQNVKQPLQKNASTQEYFTKEIEEKISEMGEKEMYALLRDLEGTPFWIAILKYNYLRLQKSQSTLFVSDPLKDASAISRTQGIMIGLSDLQNAVIMLVSEKKEKERENAEAKDSGSM